jgi:YesN/AraC family two-component response regulator
MRTVLFVDDEPSLRLTLPEILRLHGYQVTAAGTVAEALQEMQARKYDVLLTDLNIGQPGDGFTVVSAMRRTQPDAVTIILTGYPAFESALEAIRNQVDDYIVKPANIDILIGLIERKMLNEGRKSPRPDQKRISQLLRENCELMADRWLSEMSQNQEFMRLGLVAEKQCEHLHSIVRSVSTMLEEGTTSDEAFQSAREYGERRLRQGASLALILEETRVARRVILGYVQENLLAVKVSRVINEIIDICECIDQTEAQAVDSYAQEQKAS